MVRRPRAHLGKRALSQGRFDSPPYLGLTCLNANTIEPINDFHNRPSRLGRLFIAAIFVVYDVSKYEVDLASKVFGLLRCAGPTLLSPRSLSGYQNRQSPALLGRILRDCPSSQRAS